MLFRKVSSVLTAAAITAFLVIKMSSVCLIERFKILSAIPITRTLDFSNLPMTGTKSRLPSLQFNTVNLNENIEGPQPG